MAVPSLSARAVARACLGLTGRLLARRDLILRESAPPLSLRAELGFARRSGASNEASRVEAPMLVVVGTEEGSAGDRALQQRSAFGYLTAFFQRYVRGDESHDVYLAGQFLPEGLDDLHISLEHET